jgi:hypothetical protein
MDVAVLLLFTFFLTAVVVAASRGVAARPGCLCGRALAGSAPAAIVAGAAVACSPGSGPGFGPDSSPGRGSGPGGQVGSGGNGSTPGSVGSTLAVYFLRARVLSASSLVRGPGSAIGPQEG